MSISPAIINRHVYSLDVAGIRQPSAKSLSQSGVLAQRSATKKSNNRNPRLLRPPHHRPRHRATEPRDELPPPHSITSSASASKFGGMVRPSVLAVLRLMINANFVGYSTGSSFTLAPRRMRST